MPDRLLSLVLLVGCWVPPAAAGWAAARRAQGSRAGLDVASMHAPLAAFVVAWSAFWCLVNLSAMPPYIPGASEDPFYRPSQAITWLAVVTGALVLPCSALASVLAYRACWHSRRR